jgi:hypothetical protein
MAALSNATVDGILTLPAREAAAAMLERTTSEQLEVTVPLSLRISVITEPASQGRISGVATGGNGQPSSAPGPLPQLPTAGIDLDATDGPNDVPQWTKEQALGPSGAEHFLPSARATRLPA